MGTGPWAVTTTFEAVLTWKYAVVHQGLRDLYEKAKRKQWNVSVDVAWSPPVDPESEILLDQEKPHVELLQDSDIWRKMTSRERSALRYETLAWNLSQFLHGEQLAIFVAGQLAAVPGIDAKLYGSTVDVSSRWKRGRPLASPSRLAGRRHAQGHAKARRRNRRSTVWCQP